MGSVEWDGSGGSLGRTHASTQSVSDNRSRNGNDRRRKIPRTASTPNTALMGQRGGIFEQMSNPNSPPDPSNMSGFSSVVSSRPSSLGGSKHGSSTNLAGAAAHGENGVPTTCTNCFTQTTPLWRRNSEGHPLCNACALFAKLHGVGRQPSLNTDVIKRRKLRPVPASTTPTTQATTLTSKRARPVNESQSPSPATSSDGTGSTFSTPISYGGLRGSSAAASRANPAVRSDCQRRCSNSVSVIKSMDLDSLEKCTRSKEAENSLMGCSRSVVDDWGWLREPL
jgi:GATA-binding protein, other eukaryote